jgi:sialate O-acetylesterase
VLSADEVKTRYAEKAEKMPKPSPLGLPSVFGRNMVLQRDREIPVWGWSEPNDEITVSLASAKATTKADDKGKWKLRLPAQKVGGPHTMTVAGKKHRTEFKDVLIGEVWVCSGQSNMQWGVNASLDAAKEISAANYPKIRLFTVPNVMEEEPVDDFDAGWDVCSPDTVPGFSAVAYYFGRELHKELDVPIGLINTSWGGSQCEAWTSREALESDPDFKPILERAKTDLWMGRGIYNAMIHPLIPYGIRGAIWYQGESNAPRGIQYRKLFPTMIRDWRERWGQGDFPFYYVQLCPFNRHETEWPEVWEAQLMTLSVPNTGMAVTTDIGDINNIHPPNKQDVGKRLALWALAKDYGKTDLAYSGPLYKSMKVDGDKIRIAFDYAKGLKSRDEKPLSWFVIAGKDQKFHAAEATIDGDEVVIHSDKVSDPVAVRMGWSSIATPNLINEAGLPASPFRTDDWPAVSQGRN